MAIIILLLMIGVPILEIAVFVQVGGIIGLWPTLAIVILTAMAGTTLLRIQGLATLMRAQESLNAGRFPVDEVYDGLCLVLAGALLLTPGFVTDSIGLLLFIPAVRSGLRRLAVRYLQGAGRIHVWTPGGPAGPDNPRNGPGGTVIEGEFEEVDEKPRDKDGPTLPRRD